MNSKIIVTKEQVEENMKDVLCRTEMEWNHPVTYVSVRMKNGFVVRASTTCVDPANYDEKYGKQICLEKIEDQIWGLLGYALQEQIYQKRIEQQNTVYYENKLSNTGFPPFITGGLYLVDVNKDGTKAVYRRSKYTGAWDADAYYNNDKKLIMEVPDIIKPTEVFPITSEEFWKSNGGYYTLAKLTENLWAQSDI